MEIKQQPKSICANTSESNSMLWNKQTNNHPKKPTIELPSCLHCVVLPERSHPSRTMSAPRNGTFLHILFACENRLLDDEMVFIVNYVN